MKTPTDYNLKVTDGKIVLEPIKSPTNSFDKLCSPTEQPKEFQKTKLKFKPLKDLK